ncbi:MAG: AAA family ATPase [Bacilli bacterium]|nr:AAA family ATPase [Bacilli bacterium]
MAFDNEKLFVQEIKLERGKVPSFDIYPFDIKVVKNFTEIELTKPVTFFVGENGIGKSTFIEAIAVYLGLNAEGGTQNFNFSTIPTHSILSEYLFIPRYGMPKTKFFLRAESFYNVISEIQKISEDPDSFGTLYDSYGGNLHECSHGESFIKLVENRFSDKGLYILDEPEAALSPQKQMNLLCLIDDLVKKGSQFIIASHSPIIISYRDAQILDLNDNFKEIKYEDTDIYQSYKMYLNDPYRIQHLMFDEE